MMMLKKTAIALAALALPFSTVAGAASIPTYFEVRFYSDSMMTQEIGGYIWNCDGSIVTWGDVFTTPHYTEVSYDCPE
ncbi:DUF6289 family protein [Sphingomonas sp. HITSZ_GF]|uniref:DUF6289 family protein n=1 Tax=Sphingomonas sp. HITSZ_GF TaxID=3037247 RepID=UPI00240D1120|nr:DUF6289 family protein [Sphingomonas sp. HITSZ_GF]MDG2535669.1 DUF6289 family protein [Sphingomonas sp. HITSZ_GF]